MLLSEKIRKVQNGSLCLCTRHYELSCYHYTTYIYILQTLYFTTVRGNTLNGSVSIESPIGKAVLGKKKGDRVYVKVSDSAGYYVVIQDIEKTHDDGTDKLRSF